jgi:hypothetical protein
MTDGAGPRYRVSKRQVHLNVGWRWLLWNDDEQDFADEAFEAREQAEHRATLLNAGAAYEQHRHFCRRRPSYCATCRRLRAEAFPEPPAPPPPAPPPPPANNDDTQVYDGPDLNDAYEAAGIPRYALTDRDDPPTD